MELCHHGAFPRRQGGGGAAGVRRNERAERVHVELHDLGPGQERDAHRRARGVRHDAVQELRLVGRAADGLRAVWEGGRGQGAVRPDA